MKDNTAVQPIRVYLDTSDWSAITDVTVGKQNRDAAAVNALRALGASGKAVFLLSREHLEEFSGLRTGLSDRLRCVQGLPGTYLWEWRSITLIERSVAAMIDSLNGREAVQLSLTAQAFKDMPHDKLVTRVRFLKVVRPFRKGMALADNLSRRAKQTQTAAVRARVQRILKKMWVDDLGAVFKELERHDPVHPPSRGVVRVLNWAVQSLWTMAEHAKWIHPRDVPMDKSFMRHVFVHVPNDLRSDSVLLQRLRTEWLERPPPILACAKAVADSVESNLNQKLTSTGSEDLDAAHATFAPFVDVFTADKRVAPSLQKLKLQTTVLRSGRLAEVVSAIQALSAASPTESS